MASSNHAIDTDSLPKLAATSSNQNLPSMSMLLPPTARSQDLLRVVAVARGLHAWDEARARGHHEEEHERAHDDGRSPEMPRAQRVAQNAEHDRQRPGRYV